MELIRAILLSVVCAITVEGRTMRTPSKDVSMKALQVKRAVDAKSDHKAKISPELEPVSSEKFMKKDYPFDKRPKADPFHFKHPYPIVQDSGDYDEDYVKDENSDNGNWKAQETYDRLRAKLAREKRDLAEALARQKSADKELEDAEKKHAKRAKDRQEAEDARNKLKEKHSKDKQKERKVDILNPLEDKDSPVKKIIDEGKDLIDGPGNKEVDAATQKTKEAVDALEDCKKELAAAREQLKKLMEELEAAKKAQAGAAQGSDEATAKELAAEKNRDSIKKEVKDEYEDYLAAKKAYEEQLVLVSKLEAEIKVAADKVKAMRDAEDRGGGVYNTPDERSGMSGVVPKMLVLALVGLVASW